MCVKKKKKMNKILIVTILIIGTLFFSFKYLNKKSKTIFLEYSKEQSKRIISEEIISTVNGEILENIDLNEMFIIIKNTNDKIESIDLNSKLINNILNTTALKLDRNLKELENKKSILEIPLFNNGIISNIFPKIPVKLNIIGNTLCVISTNVESYGINNALFKINLDIKIDIKILMPFVSELISVNTSIPLVIKLIEGDIPKYYLDDYFNKMYSN